jgi:hypothetical protein
VSVSAFVNHVHLIAAELATAVIGAGGILDRRRDVGSCRQQPQADGHRAGQGFVVDREHMLD